MIIETLRCNRKSMDARVLIFVVIVSSCWCSYARDLTANHFAGEKALISANLRSQEDTQHMEEFRKNEDLCTLCKDFASDAIKYLSDNKTLTEIISILHKTCTKIHTFEKQCIVLVDFYAPLILSDISSMKPGDLCRKVNLCKKELSVSLNVSKDKCDLCHSVIKEALEKLKDPDTELEIVKLLVKVCGSTGRNVKKCKSLVIQHTPTILVNAQKLFETHELGTHACSSAPVAYTS